MIAHLRRVAPFAALLVIWALFFWRFAAPNPGDRLTYERGDFSETFGVFRDLTFRSINAGALPLWVECLWSGYPLHADPQAQVFYPPAWLTFAALRALGYGHFPLEALVVETALHYLFLSLFLYLFLRSRRLHPAAAVLGAVTFTYGGYATGYPPLQNTVLATNVWLPVALLFAARLAERPARSHFAALALSLALAFVAGHPQTFLFVALITLSYFAFQFQQHHPARRAGLALLLAALIALTTALVAVQLLPALQFILSSTRSGLPFAKAGSGFPFQDIVAFIVPNFVSHWNPLYVGLLPLGLALFALRHADVERRYWAALALIALVISFGTQAVAYDAAYWAVPGLGLFQGAERLAVMVSFALAVLAAHGAHAAFGRLERLPRAWMWAGLFALLFLATAALTFLVYTGAAPESWAALPGVFGRAALMVGLTFVVWRRRGAAAPGPALLVAVAVLDLFSANRPLNVSAPYVAYPVDANVLPMQAEAGFFRVQDDARLAGHAGCAYGFRETDGVTPYRLAGYDRLLSLPEPERWALLGVKFVVTWRGELLDTNGRRIPSEVVAVNETVDERGNPTRTHRLSGEPQRAWLSPDSAAGATAPVNDSVRVVSDAPGAVTLRAEVPEGAPQLVVLSEPHFAAWRVWVDGQPEALRSARAALLAVAVPPGEHTIEFRYQPDRLWAGAAISVLALVFTLALPFVSAGRRR